MHTTNDNERTNFSLRRYFTSAAQYSGTLFVIACVSLTLPASLSLIARSQYFRLRAGTLSQIPRSVLRLWIRHIFRTWITLETYFYFYYLYQKRRLSRIGLHLPPSRRRDGAGQRSKYLGRCLSCFDDISHSIILAKKSKFSRRNVTAPLTNLSQSVSGLFEKSSAMFLPRSQNSTSMENILRLSQELEAEPLDPNEELMLLEFKRKEISSWFFHTPIEQVTRGNIADWVADNFYESSVVLKVRDKPEHSDELDQLVDQVLKWARLDELVLAQSPEPNPHVRLMRLRTDPLPARHRPFWVYLISHLVLPSLTRRKLTKLGFCQYKAGTLSYWLRPGGSKSSPLLFCHGLGVGLLPYMDFITGLAQHHPDLDFFCIDMPFISMQQIDRIPSANEMCACISDMLHSWDHTSAHIIGHSFGTFVCAWLMRYRPSMVRSVSLVDPVCFMNFKSDLIYNALYAPAPSPFRDPHSWFLTYLIFKELHICYTLMRNHFWRQNNLWPEDLYGMPTFVVLGGDDPLVPSHSIKVMFEVAKERSLRSNKQDLSTIVFEAHAIHGQFWRDSTLMHKVLKGVHDTMRLGASSFIDRTMSLDSVGN